MSKLGQIDELTRLNTVKGISEYINQKDNSDLHICRVT